MSRHTGYGRLSGSTLKVIAILAMTVDHIGAFLFPDILWLRYIGRLTFPIMGFFVYEGWRHTRNIRRYGLRLLLFAAVSEIPFNLIHAGGLSAPHHQNIGFTLLLGLLALELSHKGGLGWVGAGAACLLGDLLWVDYGSAGVLSILLFGTFAHIKLPAALSVAASTLLFTYGQWSVVWPHIEWFSPATYHLIPPQTWAIAAIPLLLLYNGKRGRAPGWLFYAFYPGHLLLLYLYGPAIIGVLSPLLRGSAG